MKSLKNMKLPKNNLSHFTMMFGLLGTLCLIISHFIPSLTIGGISKFFINDEWYLVLLSIISIVTIFMGDIFIPMITSGVSLWYFIDFTKRINTVYKQYATTTTIGYGIGFYLLLVGVALLITYVVFAIKEKIKVRRLIKKKAVKEPLKNTSLNEEKPLSFTKSPLLNTTNTPIEENAVIEEKSLTTNFIENPMIEKEEIKKEEATSSIWSSDPIQKEEVVKQNEIKPEEVVQQNETKIEEMIQAIPEVSKTSIPENNVSNQTVDSTLSKEKPNDFSFFNDISINNIPPKGVTQPSVPTQEHPLNTNVPLEEEPKPQTPQPHAFTSFYDFELSPEELKRNKPNKE